MMESPTEKPRVQLLKAVRKVIVFPILINVILVTLASYVLKEELHSKCPPATVISTSLLWVVALFRVIWIFRSWSIQGNMALAMAAESGEKKLIEILRRRWYKRWLWWNRVGSLTLLVQVVAAGCVFGNTRYCSDEKLLQILLKVLPAATLTVVVLSWQMGPDIISWRSFYKTDDAWRAYHSEVFRSCIREALCCLGPIRYLRHVRNEEVGSIASMLSELVSYRAEGCSDFELLAGVSLLSHGKSRERPKRELAPEDQILEASVLHPYAVAAYTGALLEIGRNPGCWLLTWLYSLGLFSFWKRNSRPEVLEGDNWWRGHAAAFLRHSRLPLYTDARLVKGRVQQTARQSAYFVVVLEDIKIVLVAVRGTETPEDLLTDGLSEETPLKDSDLLGLLKGPNISEEVRQKVKKRSHHAHRGIIEAARELSMQLDNLAEDDDDDMVASKGHTGGSVPDGVARKGLLSTLLGSGGDCEGYDVRLVGHSLGGAVSALTGLRLYQRYPNLRVYAFGVLPCVDKDIAEACQDFVTSVVNHDEFSSRLSATSLKRLRTNALAALSDPPSKSEGNKRRKDENSSVSNANLSSTPRCAFFEISSSESHGRVEYSKLSRTERLLYLMKGVLFLCVHTRICLSKMSEHHKSTPTEKELYHYRERLSLQRNGQDVGLESESEIHFRESMTRLVPPNPVLTEKVWSVTVDMDRIPLFSSGEELEEPGENEMLLPGKVIHIVREENSKVPSSWKLWRVKKDWTYQAYVADRMEFLDLIISPTMFIDHMPWKCQHALSSIVLDRLRASNQAPSRVAHY